MRKRTLIAVGATLGFLLIGAVIAGLAVPSTTTSAKRGDAVVTRPVASPTTTTPAVRRAASVVVLPSGETLLASLDGRVATFHAPSGKANGTLAPTWDGARLTLPVIAQRPGWLDVRIPQRPNGSTRWIRNTDVALSESSYRIVIDLHTDRLMLIDHGVVAATFPAGVGTTTDPTPVGNFFIAYLAEPPSAGYGPFVIVTSAHSNTISDWERSGDAEIAIHGPLGEDAEIGTTGARISHGCVRLHVSDLEALRDVPVGTPVDIVAT